MDNSTRLSCTPQRQNMSKKPVLEEVDDDDIDNMDMDIAEFDPSLKTPIAPLRQGPTVTRSQDAEPPLFPTFTPPTPAPATGQNTQQQDRDIMDPNKFTDEEREEFRKFQIIYPCYFDKNRSHNDGRRVSINNAVENPLAYSISQACRFLNVPVLLELDKSHPQDFGNPGRVRVLIKEDHQPSDERFKSKRALLNAISKYLKLHPTELSTISPSGPIPCPSEYKTGFTPEELPKVLGFKMNTIVPIHSQYTLKHPMTKSIYDQQPPDPTIEAPKAPKVPKKKIMKIRG